MTLTPGQEGLVKEKAVLWSSLRRFIVFLFVTVLPFTLGLWREFWGGPEKLDNVILVYILLLIALKFVFMVFMGIALLSLLGHESKDFKKKLKKDPKFKKDQVGSACTLYRANRTCVTLRALVYYAMIVLFIYMGYTFLGLALIVLTVAGVLMGRLIKRRAEELIKRYMFQEEDEDGESEEE